MINFLEVKNKALSDVFPCDVLPSGFTKYYKNDTELTLISTIYTELTA